MLETISTVSIIRHLVTGINAQCPLQYCNMSIDVCLINAQTAKPPMPHSVI